jgi:chorismate mutase
MWQIAIDLNQRIPNLPIICDPSHIAGKSELIYEVSQKAMDLGQYGLIIETHPNPKVALSDARQQITPDQLGEILKRLVIRDSEYEHPETKHTLEQLRLSINTYDEELLKIMHKRMEVVKQIGKHKKENNIRIIQTKRWDEIISGMENKGAGYGLSSELIDQVFKAIHQESINIQINILNS